VLAEDKCSILLLPRTNFLQRIWPMKIWIILVSPTAYLFLGYVTSSLQLLPIYVVLVTHILNENWFAFFIIYYIGYDVNKSLFGINCESLVFWNFCSPIDSTNSVGWQKSEWKRLGIWNKTHGVFRFYHYKPC